MQAQAISECIKYIDKTLDKLYEEHVDQFTYMMETHHTVTITGVNNINPSFTNSVR